MIVDDPPRQPGCDFHCARPNGIGLVDDALATGGWEAGGKIAWVLLPFLATVAINRLFGLFYLGPVAVFAAVAIATFLLRRKGRRWHDLGFRRPRSWTKTILGAVGLYFAFLATVAFLILPLSGALELGRPDVGRVLIVRHASSRT